MVKNKLASYLGERLIKMNTIARETGISTTTLRKMYYRKSKVVSLDVLDKLCKYMGCEITDLIEYQPDPDGDNQ